MARPRRRSAAVSPSADPGEQGADGPGLGTFGGVFTPSILTILGLVLFLRVPFVVGSVGIVRALVILALATSVSVLTSISLATVATNMRIGSGGEYYLISRTLGIEFGGAVGVLLWLAISVSIGFYAIGFAEAIAGAMAWQGHQPVQLVAAVTILVLLAIGLIGADLATRLQYVVMGLLVLSLCSFFVGVLGHVGSAQLANNVDTSSQGVGFWEAFAIFFPAVTGFSQGVAMSGDLRTPSRSITRGTFAAVGVSTIVYVATSVLLAGAAPAANLVDETTTIMGDLSLAGPTILVGVLAATISSALASTLGGPRVLQRLGDDRVLPRLEWFALGAGPANNPRRATLVSAAIALATVAMGDLNAIAPVISMFFLASYGMINYATLYEIRAGGTSFRPSFRWYDRRASLAGTVACGGAILAINPIAGALAGIVLAGLYSYLRRRDVPDRWSDSAGAYHYTQARKHLRRMASEPFGSRGWRPNMLVFVPRNPTARGRMLRMSSWIEGSVGFLTAVRLIEGTGRRVRAQAAEIEVDLAAELVGTCPGAGARVVTVADIETGIPTLVQSHGLGDLRPNLSVFGAQDLRGDELDRDSYGRMLQGCARQGTNVAVVAAEDHAWERFEATPRRQRTIALWWSDDQVGQFITLMAWLATRDPEWAEAKVVAHVPVSADPGESDRVAALLTEARIDAEVVQVDPTAAALADALGGATLALAPLRVRRGRATGPFESSIGMLVESLPLAVFVLVVESLELSTERDIALTELVEATEKLAESRRWVAELDERAAGLLVAAEAARLELASADECDRPRLQTTVAEAEAAASSAFRSYVDAKARLRALTDRVDDLDPNRSSHDLDPSIWRSAGSQRSAAG